MPDEIKKLTYLDIFRYMQVAFKVDGFYFKSCKDREFNNLIPAQCFDKAKEEVIEQLESDIQYIRLLTFADFQLIKKELDFNPNSSKRNNVETRLQRSPAYREHRTE